MRSSAARAFMNSVITMRHRVPTHAFSLAARCKAEAWTAPHPSPAPPPPHRYEGSRTDRQVGACARLASPAACAAAHTSLQRCCG